MKKQALLLVMLAVSPAAFSQPAPATSEAVRVITLGDSVVALDGDWKFQPGDSPWVDGAPLWAQPGYDDVRWATQNLTLKAGTVDVMLGTSGFVPGWTSQGYPNLSGYAWYRLRVKVANPGQKLWLKMPNDFDDAYQLYANGSYISQFGNFSRKPVTLYEARSSSFQLPQSGPDGVTVLAIRFYMSPATQFNDPNVGGMHGPPALGRASVVQLLQSSAKRDYRDTFLGQFLLLLLCLLVAPLALWAWFYNRHERAWLWMFLALAWGIALALLELVTHLTTRLGLGCNIVGEDILVFPFWILFWWEWFGLQEKRWIPRAAWLLAAAMILTAFIAQSPFFGLHIVPLSALHWFNDASNVWFLIPYELLYPVILFEGFRRDRTEALLAAFPILLSSFNAFSNYLAFVFHVPELASFLGGGIYVQNIRWMLTILVIGALALRRFIKTRVRDSLAQQNIKKDLEQAQQLQQRVLIPEDLHSPHFRIETAYHPAQTVGGDFFQTLTRLDGTLLVVIGDVSGKGVSAAMLVAVLVGAIRNQADYNFDPAAMLAMLNQRLIGRSGGHFATCVAAEISPDGTMRIANAGHIPPYLNGRELVLDGSLPLGIMAGVEYGAQAFALKQGDRLTFVTDGVVEATNESKELFGFDRTQAISALPAGAIAQQAQGFGQEDDITVLGVEFAPAVAQA